MTSRKKSEEPAENSESSRNNLPECFVIMPIAEKAGYKPDHFKRVYLDLIVPACKEAGFRAMRADDIKRTDFIHESILKRLLDSPMVVCDLSTLNPNVMFELALRQAFEKPVCLIQEVGTPRIFDISFFRVEEYRPERVFHEVLSDRVKLARAIKETYEAHQKGDGTNSIIRLLSLPKASLRDLNNDEVVREIYDRITKGFESLEANGRQQLIANKGGMLTPPRSMVLPGLSSPIYRRINDLLSEVRVNAADAQTYYELDECIGQIADILQDIAVLDPKSPQGIAQKNNMILEAANLLKYTHKLIREGGS